MAYTPEQLRKGVQEVFKVYDVNSDGYLDKSQATKLVNEAMTDLKVVSNIISEMDLNKDGKISKQELYVVYERLLNGTN